MKWGMKLWRGKTKLGTLQAALEMLVRVARQPDIRDLRGKLHWKGNLDKMRVDQKP